MIKYMRHKWVLVTCLLLIGNVYSACEDIDEVPPRIESVGVNDYYKLPEPVVLNADEIAVIDAVKEEYNQHIVQ